MDFDGSGSIEYQEFVSKVNRNLKHEKKHEDELLVAIYRVVGD